MFARSGGLLSCCKDCEPAFGGDSGLRGSQRGFHVVYRAHCDHFEATFRGHILDAGGPDLGLQA